MFADTTASAASVRRSSRERAMHDCQQSLLLGHEVHHARHTDNCTRREGTFSLLLLLSSLVVPPHLISSRLTSPFLVSSLLFSALLSVSTLCTRRRAHVARGFAVRERPSLMSLSTAFSGFRITISSFPTSLFYEGACMALKILPAFKVAGCVFQGFGSARGGVLARLSNPLLLHLALSHPFSPHTKLPHTTKRPLLCHRM